MFEELEEMRIRVWEEDKYEKWFVCYDFEAFQRDFRKGVDQGEELDSEEGTSWNKVHVPVSFCVGCNLEGVETYHVSSKDPEELTAKLVGTLLELVDKKYRVAIERCEYIFEQINDLMQMERDGLSEINRVMVDEFLDEDDLEMDENGGFTSKHLKSYKIYFQSLKGIVKNWPCLDLILLVMTWSSLRSFCLKNCANAVKNLLSLSKRLESINASRLNTWNSWTFCSF